MSVIICKKCGLQKTINHYTDCIREQTTRCVNKFLNCLKNDERKIWENKLPDLKKVGLDQITINWCNYCFRYLEATKEKEFIIQNVCDILQHFNNFSKILPRTETCPLCNKSISKCRESRLESLESIKKSIIARIEFPDKVITNISVIISHFGLIFMKQLINTFDKVNPFFEKIEPGFKNMETIYTNIYAPSKEKKEIQYHLIYFLLYEFIRESKSNK